MPTVAQAISASYVEAQKNHGVGMIVLERGVRSLTYEV